MQSASIAVNARLAGFYSASGRLLCRDALGAAEVRRAYLNERFLRDRVAVQRKRDGQTASAPIVVEVAEGLEHEVRGLASEEREGLNRGTGKPSILQCKTERGGGASGPPPPPCRRGGPVAQARPDATAARADVPSGLPAEGPAAEVPVSQAGPKVGAKMPLA